MHKLGTMVWQRDVLSFSTSSRTRMHIGDLVLPEWITKSFHLKTVGFTAIRGDIREHWQWGYRILRVLSLGDSIAHGTASTDGNGYRGEFHDLTPKMLRKRPNVVVLYVSTNGMKDDASAASATSGMATLVDEILTKCPDAALLVAKLVASRDSTAQGYINSYNAALGSIVSSSLAARKRVRIMHMDPLITNNFTVTSIGGDDSKSGASNLATANTKALPAGKTVANYSASPPTSSTIIKADILVPDAFVRLYIWDGLDCDWDNNPGWAVNSKIDPYVRTQYMVEGETVFKYTGFTPPGFTNAPWSWASVGTVSIALSSYTYTWTLPIGTSTTDTCNNDTANTGNYWGNRVQFRGVSIPGINCAISGNDMRNEYQNIRDIGGCKKCGSYHRPDSGLVTVNYVTSRTGFGDS
ncbi:hypothetical protein B0O99DRAFT_689492 [Bisporella sp. PMI_857]|nr:hypothetical protein B0O99DRAFT_689492 [Bisporella sp. PMI_857]